MDPGGSIAACAASGIGGVIGHPFLFVSVTGAATMSVGFTSAGFASEALGARRSAFCSARRSGPRIFSRSSCEISHCQLGIVSEVGEAGEHVERAARLAIVLYVDLGFAMAQGWRHGSGKVLTTAKA